MQAVSLMSILRSPNSQVKSVLHINTEVAIVTITSANGAYGPGESYTLRVSQLP
jgi:hypothetical protein